MCGDQGLVEIATYKSDEKILLVSALVGAVGLIPTIEAIKIKRDIALANKETLVMAGDIVMDLARANDVKIFPIDSEHSAIWQCITGEDDNEIKNLIITASGGSFRDLSRDELKDVTKKRALNHPNWKMGEKITIDSSTMMNKGFEVIEAHHLFNIGYEKIKTILHKESIVHSMVEFEDNQIKAQLGNSDMRLPIIYAINYPRRVSVDFDGLDLIKCGKLTFEELSYERFPCLRFAYEAGVKGNVFPVVLNAANEAAVDLFLKDKIDYLVIEKIIEEQLKNTTFIDDLTIDVIIKVDQEVKKNVYSKYGGNN